MAKTHLGDLDRVVFHGKNGIIGGEDKPEENILILQ